MTSILTQIRNPPALKYFIMSQFSSCDLPQTMQLKWKCTAVSICGLRFGHHCHPATLPQFIPNVPLYCPLHNETLTLAILNHVFLHCTEATVNHPKFRGTTLSIGNPATLISGVVASHSQSTGLSCFRTIIRLDSFISPYQEFCKM